MEYLVFIMFRKKEFVIVKNKKYFNFWQRQRVGLFFEYLLLFSVQFGQGSIFKYSFQVFIYRDLGNFGFYQFCIKNG